MDALFGSENEAGSLVFRMPENEMIKWLSTMSGVKEGLVKIILDDLIFDASSLHSSLGNQPFVKANTLMFLLARLISSLDPMRLLAGALNKGSKQSIYAKFIQQNLQNVLNLNGYDYEIEKIYGVLLFLRPMAIPTPGNSKIFIADWASLNRMLSQNPKISLQKIIEWIEQRPDIDLNKAELQFVSMGIEVGDWKYRRQIVAQT